MWTFWDDVRFAARMLGRNKLLTVVAAMTLALGMGANTAIYSTVSGILWNTLPYAEPERLVSVWGHNQRQGLNQTSVSWRDSEEWRAARCVEKLTQFRQTTGALRGDGEPQSVQMVEAGPEFFDVLREQAAIGRTFEAGERPPGEHRVAVITESLWRRQFAADPAAVGREMQLDGRNYTIVGVMPPGFQFMYSRAEVFLPLRLTEEQLTRRDTRGLRVIARLAPGAGVEQANAEIQSISKSIEAQQPDTHRGWSASARPLELDVIDRGARMSIQTMFWAVMGVLLIACANVSSLLLARGTLRRRELAIRAALGAGKGRITRLLLTESALLSLMGGVLATAFAAWAIPVLRSLAPRNFPRLEFVRLDPAALAYTFLLCLVCGLVAGIAPAWMLSRGELARSLHEGGRGGTFSRQRTLQGLVAAEIALATVLLTVTGLLVRSLSGQLLADPGFDKSRLVAGAVALPQALYPENHQQADFFRAVLESLRRDPRVLSAAASQTVPLGGSSSWSPITVEGGAGSADQRDMTGFMIVTPGYFETYGIPMLAGREFNGNERAKTPEVAVINQTMARRFWPGDPQPVGRRFRLGGPAEKGSWRTVIGIARDVHHQSPVLPPRPEMYVPLDQFPSRRMILVARTQGSPAGAAPALRAAVQAVDRNLPVTELETFDEMIERRSAGPRVTVQILGFLSVLALLLSGIGVYGVQSYLTSQRSKEIGLRVALGALRGDVLKLVLRRGFVLAGIGLAVGIAAAAGVTPLIRRILEGVEPHDPVTFSASIGTLLVVALLACAFPAARALRVDPVRVLRDE